jgi:multidrug efflux system membrane fusion protein
LTAETKRPANVGRIITWGVALAAFGSAVLVLAQANHNPRTDDATVRANYIEVAPEVSGRIVELRVRDNQIVSKGTLLFAIDQRPYQYALDQALADQQLLEKQIGDAQRRIHAQASAVEAAQAEVATTQANAETAGSNVEVARAAVEQAEASVHAADAQLELVVNNLRRLEPLLAKQYVTVEQVDQARVAVRVAEQRRQEAQAALSGARANQLESASRHRAAQTLIPESRARLSQSISTVDTLDSLIAQRPAKAARVDSAQLDLERCRVVAPFDGYVTNSNISEGAYATTGKPVFTLIDRRSWYVVANFRESELVRIQPGRSVDVYVMSHPDRRIQGVVESLGYGVFPEDGKVDAGLPAIDKTLNWVHLAARFPVRIRIENSGLSQLRMGETAVSIVR